jgi:uncharacterized membrane protein
MSTTDYFDFAGVACELLGVTAMVVGIVLALIFSVRVLIQSRDASEAVRTLRTIIGGSILLGLEILLAADLIKTVTSWPALSDLYALGVIVVIRTILSFTIQIEIDGTLPWRRVLTRSGASVVSQALSQK